VYYNSNVSLEFFRRAEERSKALGVFPAAFNPPTLAHLALARAALATAGEVLFVLPREFPHKPYEGATFEQRVEMLVAATRSEPRFSIAASHGGLFAEIAQECHESYGEDVRLLFLCGRDAAERIVTWDYGEPGAFERMIERFELFVAPRDGHYEPPPAIRHRVTILQPTEDTNLISASEVRDRLRQNASWEHLVPPEIVPMVRAIYG
jgi:nicotinate (nicotinamide) nucleotide adenylyltransferase